MYQIAVLSFAVLFISVTAFGSGPQPKTGGDTDDEWDVWPCWHDINCKLGGGVFEEMNECYNMLDKSDMEVYVYEWLDKAGHKNLNTIIPKELCDKLCPLEMERKKETFDSCVQQFMDAFKKASSSSDKEELEALSRMQSFMDCAKKLLDREKENGNCG